jgi:hypothetical protein
MLRGKCMQNLRAKIVEQETKYLNDRIEKFKEELKEVKENNVTWTEQYMGRKKPYIKDRENKVIKRLKENSQKEVDRLFKKIDLVNSASDNLERSIIINIVFSKSRTWGYCPVAEDNFGNYAGSITGCGYDKESTASAKILNCHNLILKRMYKLKNDNIDIKNGELFGYGSGYSLLPFFEGGVGIDCHIRILEKLDFKVLKMSTSTTTILTILE